MHRRTFIQLCATLPLARWSFIPSNAPQQQPAAVWQIGFPFAFTAPDGPPDPMPTAEPTATTPPTAPPWTAEPTPEPTGAPSATPLPTSAPLATPGPAWRVWLSYIEAPRD